jgi:bifunctional N-acetylglucosamine-1-phosphate-uridyltransferase/glucosamine-1-phosphate-acetyltransferase GlmU-like protein
MTNKTLIAAERETLKTLMTQVRESRARIKFLVADQKNERVLTKIVRQEAKRLRAEKIAEKKAAAAAKKSERTMRLTAKAAEQKARLEARLAALEAKILKAKSPKALKKANKKASAVTFISAEQVAA